MKFSRVLLLLSVLVLAFVVIACAANNPLRLRPKNPPLPPPL